MEIGVILGYFYGKGLILCPNNILRYFELDRNTYYAIENKFGWNLHEDRKHNVKTIGRIEADLVAIYSRSPTNKYEVKIEHRFTSADEDMMKRANKFYVYLKQSKLPDLSRESYSDIDRLYSYVNRLDIQEILTSYKVNLYKKSNDDSTSWINFVETDDAYIKKLLFISNVSSSYIEENNILIGRDYEREEQHKKTFIEKYDKNEHLSYLLKNTICPKIAKFQEDYKSHVKITSFLEAQFPVGKIAEILYKTWPHMKAELLCYKYNEEFQEGCEWIFGDKHCSRREYLKRRKGMLKANHYRNHDNDYSYSSWDPESEIMNSLMYGDPEIFGF